MLLQICQNFVKVSYDQSSPLCFGDYLLSDEGAQQVALGPLLFYLTTRRLTRNISSELNLWFHDDGSVGGSVVTLYVVTDLPEILRQKSRQNRAPKWRFFENYLV